jgi:flagellar hook assembly protein FlgD
MIGRCVRELEALSLAAFLLVAVCVPAFATPSVDGIQVRPNPFSPNGNGSQDNTELFFTPAGAGDSVLVTVSVFRDAGNVFLGELLSNVSLPSGVAAQVVWNPGVLADGLYRFEIEVTDGSETIMAPAFVEADSSPPSLFINSIQPNPYDPAAPPPDNALSIFFTVATTDSSTLTNLIVRQGTVVEDSLGSVADAGLHSLTWDGQRTNGTPAPSGIYQIFAEARDLAGNSSSASQAFTVDRNAPEFIFESDSLQTTSFPFVFDGLVADNDRVVDVRVRFDPDTNFVAVNSMGSPADTVDFTVIVDDAAPEPGFRTFTVRAFDDVGHTADQEFVLAYDTVLPVNVTSFLVDGSGPYHEREVVRIRTQWNLDSLHVTGNFSDLDSEWRGGEETVVNEGNGFYLVSYELSRSNTRPPANRRVLIRAATVTDSIPNGILAATDTVLVALAAGAVAEFRVDRNLLDPMTGDVVTVEAPEETDPLEVEIYNLTGARVRKLEGTGEVAWDGRTEEGAMAASGTYFLRLQSNSAEEVRRLVVRKGGG